MRLRAPFESWHEHLAIALPGARAVFTTRRGGFSSGPFRSLNLGMLTDDEPEAVRRNRRRLQEQVGRPLAMIHQVHGTRLRHLDRLPEGNERLEKADGQLTDLKGVAPIVLVADCLPVVLAGEGAVAILHAGWRGLSGGILRDGLDALRASGVSGAVQAAIGPGIGACCYEVGEEVHREFTTYGAEVRRGNNLDLSLVARRQLEQAGVEAVHDCGLCTACMPELFFSHRRDHGVTGRQAGVAWLS